MDEEMNFMLRHLTNKNKQHIQHLVFFTGWIDKHQLIVFKTGIGKVNAAVGTMLLIEHFNPDYIINMGAAGGLKSTLEIGDIILADHVCYHDVDLTFFDGYQKGQLPGYKTSYFSLDPRLHDIFSKNFKDTPYHQGLLVSGDTFIHNTQQALKIQNDFPDALACDMEATAIAHVCHQQHTPCSILRAISDIPMREKKEEFSSSLDHICEIYTKILLEIFQSNALDT